MQEQSQIIDLTKKVKLVMDKYKIDYPEVKMDRDYFPFKITEECGECLQAYLMLTDRGRQKDKSKVEIKNDLSKEIADVFGYLLFFADSEGIDIEKAISDKWLRYLQHEK